MGCEKNRTVSDVSKFTNRFETARWRVPKKRPAKCRPLVLREKQAPLLFLLRNIQIRQRPRLGLGGHADRFGECRVRVDREPDVVGVGAHFDRQTGLGDQVAGARAHGTGADDAIIRDRPRLIVNEIMPHDADALPPDRNQPATPSRISHLYRNTSPASRQYRH